MPPYEDKPDRRQEGDIVLEKLPVPRLSTYFIFSAYPLVLLGPYVLGPYLALMMTSTPEERERVFNSSIVLFVGEKMNRTLWYSLLSNCSLDFL